MAKAAPDDIEIEPRPVSSLRTEEIDELLATGERDDELAAFFGPEEFAAIQQAKPPRRARRGAPRRVFILPGIMGSTLGSDGQTVWINFVRLARGRTTELSLDLDPVRHEALDVVPYFYFSLRRRLAAEGFEPVYFPFDWRLDLEELGRRFAEVLAAEPAPVDVIGHSMGGLVARLAMRTPEAAANVSRLVMMGTPNKGSFNAAQVFDGTHSTAALVARLDLRHDMADLIERVFVTLPGVYQLLPFRSAFETSGVYDEGQWPADRFAPPRQAQLTRAEAVTNLYPAPDERYYVIASAAHETAVGITVTPDGVAYQLQAGSGDGTVPLTSAFLAGVKTKLVDAEHMYLPKNGQALDAVVEVLNSEPAAWHDDGVRRGLDGARRTVTADELRRVPVAPASVARRAGELSPAEQRSLLDAAFRPTRAAEADANPAAVGLAAPAVMAALPDTFSLAGGRILERPRRRLEVVLARGSLTDAEERVGVVGLFQNVQAGGAAGSIDALTGGAVSDLRDRRMFDGLTGQVFILPTPTRRVAADFILLLGLGKFEELTEPVYRFAAANVVRTLVRCKFRELATVVPGTTGTVPLTRALGFLLRGFLDGLEEADPAREFRRITICEIDPARQEELKRALVQMATTGAFGATEVILNETTLAAVGQPVAGDPVRAGGAADPRPAYLSVRSSGEDSRETTFGYSLLLPGGRATVLKAERMVKVADLDALLKKFYPAPTDLDKLGAELADLVLPGEMRTALASDAMANTHLTFVTDEAASHVPWEALPALTGENGTPPALAGGVSRLLEAGGLAVSKWTQARREDRAFRVLLVVDPTGDLPGAVAEGKAVARVLTAGSGLAVEQLTGSAATREKVAAALASGLYDCVHYAGHAKFVPTDIGRSGLSCADGPLTAHDVAALTPLPTLLVFNACESGRVRRDDGTTAPKEDARLRLARAVSFAEAFLRNGVAQFVGTYWPVEDAAAEVFGGTFYTALAAGATVGAALLSARARVKESGSNDWADYIHYGDPHFALKVPG